MPNTCFGLAQRDIDDQWRYYEQMAGMEREIAKRADRLDSDKRFNRDAPMTLVTYERRSFDPLSGT